MKKYIAGLTAVSLLTALVPIAASADSEKSSDIVILYTNDVHCGIDDNIGYDGLALYKREMEAQYEHVILADAGDAIQGAPVGTLSEGAYIIELMNAVGYDVATLGNHEFDFSVPKLKEHGSALDCGYTCANFTSTVSGGAVFDSFKMFDFGDEQVAFVGATTPETFSAVTPSFFMNEEGERVYSFGEKDGAIYDLIQKSVDEAREAGADYVILLGHLGETDVTEAWSAQTIVSETTGIDAVIDGHSHDTTPELVVQNKDGKDVTITQTGTKLKNIGKMIISADGIKTELIDSVPAPDESMGLDADSWEETEGREGRYADTVVSQKISEIRSRIDVLLESKFGQTDFDLLAVDPESGAKIVRSRETNLGDLCTDAFRTMFGTDAAVLNAGGIKKNIPAGDITYNSLLTVFPYGNIPCTAEVTGQQILDLLEFGAMKAPEENTGLYQVSGIEYTIDTTVPSGVETNEYDEVIAINGERRVKNVKIGGEPIDPEKKYTLASINYLFVNGGDGKIISGKSEATEYQNLADVDVVAKFIENAPGGVIPEEYKDPDGQGRITISDVPVEVPMDDDKEKPADDDKEKPADETPDTPDIPAAAVFTVGDVRGRTRVLHRYDGYNPGSTESKTETASSSTAAASAAVSTTNTASAAASEPNPNTGAKTMATVILTLSAACVIVGRKSKK